MEYTKRTHQLTRLLLESLNYKFETVHTFLPIIEKREPDTFLISEQLRRENKRLVISRTHPGRVLEHVWWTDQLEIKKNNWGIPEPLSGDTLNDLSEIDVVLVPLITFDRKGHRIGYGGGYYDIFLPQVPGALKVGLSLGPPLDRIVYCDTHDQLLDWCITPYQVYKFS